MKRAGLTFASLFFILFTFCLSGGWAQQYPAKPVNMIIGWGAGGATDITLRTLCEAAGKTLGQPIVVTEQAGRGFCRGPGSIEEREARRIHGGKPIRRGNSEPVHAEGPL